MPNNNANVYFLIRHGQSVFNAQERHQGWTLGNPLSPLGKQQAKAMAKKIQSNEIDLIISSSSLRTRQTAREVAKVIGKPVSHSRKIWDFHRSKAHEGLTRTEYRARADYLLWKEKVAQDPNFSLPDGESWTEFVDRINKFARLLDVKHKNKKIAIITHKDVIWQLIEYWTRESFERDKIDNAIVYKLAEGKIISL